GSPPEFTP
ncbi:hypothetical protein CP8484711_1847B, partial [Chlamydia psittaci 84-8471/1]